MSDKDYPVMHGFIYDTEKGRAIIEVDYDRQAADAFGSACEVLDDTHVVVIQLAVYQRLAKDRMEQRQAWDNLRAEVQQWREACAKRTHELAAKDDRITNLKYEIDLLHAKYNEMLTAKDDRIAELERQMHNARETVEILERKTSAFRCLLDDEGAATNVLHQIASLCGLSVYEPEDVAGSVKLMCERFAEQDRLAELERQMAARQKRILGDLDNAMSRMSGDLANAQEMVRAIIVDAMPDEAPAEDPDSQPMFQPRERWVEEEPVSAPRPVPPWCTLTGDELSFELTSMRMNGRGWYESGAFDRIDLNSWPIWEWQSDTEAECGTVVQPVELDRLYLWRPQRLPSQDEHGVIPAAKMTAEHFDRVAEWQWRDGSNEPWSRAVRWRYSDVAASPSHEEWRPAIWAELERNPNAIQTQSEPAASWQIPCQCGCPGSVAVADIQTGDRDVRPDDMIAVAFRPYRMAFTRENGYLYEHRLGDIHGRDTRAIQQVGRSHWMLPAEEPTTEESPTFAAQIRAHAERAGYEFLMPEFELHPWWMVQKGLQTILRWDSTGLGGRVGMSWVKMSEESALRFAQSWPSKES